MHCGRAEATAAPAAPVRGRSRQAAARPRRWQGRIDNLQPPEPQHMASGSGAGNGHVAATHQASSSTSSGLPAQLCESPPPGTRVQATAPLGAVVSDAVRRWFLEAHREAQRGDVKAQALLGQMLIEGYGCEPDPVAGKEWAEKARRRGYRMNGVYCRI